MSSHFKGPIRQSDVSSDKLFRIMSGSVIQIPDLKIV